MKAVAENIPEMVTGVLGVWPGGCVLVQETLDLGTLQGKRGARSLLTEGRAPHPELQASRNPWSCRAPRPGLEEPQQCTGWVSKHSLEALGTPGDSSVCLCRRGDWRGGPRQRGGQDLEPLRLLIQAKLVDSPSLTPDARRWDTRGAGAAPGLGQWVQASRLGDG